MVDGGTITMLQNVAVPYNVGLYFTLDLSTYTLSSNDSPVDLLDISNGTELTITGEGTIINEDEECAVYVDYSSSLNILGGHFEAEEDAIYGIGTVIITAGTFVATDDSEEDGCLYGEGISIDSSSLATPLDWRETNATSVTVEVVTPTTNPYLSTLTYNVDSGTYSSVPGFDPQVPEYEIVLNPSTSPTALIGIGAVPAISGAGISIYPASSFNLVNGEGTVEITVTATGGVTQVTYTVNFRIGAANFSTGGNTYEALEEAVDAVANNGTIAMLQNVVVPSMVVLNTNKTFTIDLDGHTLSGGEDAIVVLLVGNQATATIQNGSIVNDNGVCLAVEGIATLIDLNASAADGLFSGTAVLNLGQTYIVSGEYYGSEDAVYAVEGSVEITSGIFRSDAGLYSSGCLAEEDGTISLFPGSVSDPSESEWSTALYVVVSAAPSAPTVHPVIAHFGTFDGTGTRSATVDADHTGFVRLEKDGQIVDSSHYSITPGSTVITLTENHMSAHDNGDHTYRAVFEDGYADVNLTVAVTTPITPTPVPTPDTPDTPGTPDTPAIPQTGDSSNITGWLAVLILSAVWVVGTLAWRRREKVRSWQ